MRKQQQYRQGDVLITRNTDRPNGEKQVPGKIVLAEGETTGHAHRIACEPNTADWWKDNGEQTVVVRQSATVVHEEHAPIPLTRGTYKVRRQSEYSPAEIRQVTD